MMISIWRALKEITEFSWCTTSIAEIDRLYIPRNEGARGILGFETTDTKLSSKDSTTI